MSDDAIKDARIVELERECERLREKELATRQQAIALIEEAQALMRPQGAWEEEVEGLKEEVVTLWHALIDYENWIEQALRAGTPPDRPASFGQWRRPEKKEERDGERS